MRSLLQGMSQQQSQLAAAQAQTHTPSFPPTPAPPSHRSSLAPQPQQSYPSRSNSGQPIDFQILSPKRTSAADEPDVRAHAAQHE
jgi:hypothetical protein